MRIQVLGDEKLVKHIMCKYDILHRMLYIEVKASKGADVTAMRVVQRLGNANNCFQDHGYRPLRVTRVDVADNRRSAEIRFFPEGHDEKCVIEDTHFLAPFVTRRMHKFAVVPTKSDESRLVVSWPNQCKWY